MSSYGMIDDLPLTVAIDANGMSKHIDEVPNGKACGCFCPAPDCGQPLIARQGDKLVHHFAHVGGSDCAYAVDAGLHTLAREIIERERKILFPSLRYFDYIAQENKLISEAKLLHPISVELASLSGRRVPEIVVQCQTPYHAPRTFAVVVWLRHPLTQQQCSELERRGIDTVEINLNKLYKAMKAEVGRHLDAVEAYESILSPDSIRDALIEDTYLKTWAYNRKRAEAERVGLKAKRDQDAMLAAVEAAKEARKRAEEEERCKLLEVNATALRVTSVNGVDQIYECPISYEANLQKDCLGWNWGRSRSGRRCKYFLRHDAERRVVICNGVYEMKEIIRSEKCPICEAPLADMRAEMDDGHEVALHACSVKLDYEFACKKLNCDHDWVPRIVDGGEFGMRCVKCGYIKPAFTDSR